MKNLLNSLFLSSVILCFAAACSCSKSSGEPNNTTPPEQEEYTIPYGSFQARDPFIVQDPETDLYYLHVNNKPGFKVYESKDLKMWKDNGNAFVAGADFWGKEDFWAPDVYYYQGKYYLFATFSAPGKKRGTSILVSDKPDSGFKPLVNGPITPADWMCLDGSLHVDDAGTPWLLFCREWLEVGNGEIYLQQLSTDLKTTVGEPILLFNAGSAAWTGTITAHGTTGYVTDAPFVHKAMNGQLLMLWSSFTKAGKYAIGIARSESGNLAGPWTLDDTPINDDHGGHAMLFRASGRLMISYHAPNDAPSYPVLYEVVENDGRLTIMK
jgi:Beta-xylosidase